MQKLLIFLCLLPSLAIGQVNLDSLWSIWDDNSQADTARLKAMQKISFNGYLFTQPDSSVYFAQLQFEFAEEKGQSIHMANALNTQGIAFSFQGDYVKAMKYHAKRIFSSSNEKDLKIDGFKCLHLKCLRLYT